MIKIKSRREGFRRCSMAHSTQWKEYPNNHFSKAEKEILKAEPMLIVEITDEKKAKEA